MATTIFLEMTVPGRREPIIMSFVLFSNSLDKRFDQPIFFKFWLFLLFLNDTFLEFMDVRLNVYFRYCFENSARASLVLWVKAYFPTSIRMFWYIIATLTTSWLFYLIHDHLNFPSVYMFCSGGNYFWVGIFLFSSRSIKTNWSTFKVCSSICFRWHFYQKDQTLIDEMVITLLFSNVFNEFECFVFWILFCSN